jgi:hypothetical protein
MPVYGRLKDLLVRKPLRAGFDAIKAKDRTPELLRNACTAIVHNLGDATSRAFYLWKLLTTKDALHFQINTMKSHARTRDGVEKL